MKTLEQLGISSIPWKMEYSNDIDRVVNISDANNKTIVETDYGFYPPELPDARMMTAAPELYDALQSLVEYIDRECIPCGETACELMYYAHNALAKASGESEAEK